MGKKTETRKCLYSGEEFIPKRNNQVFASRVNRISYHNEINNKLRNELKKTNNQLLLNYKISKNLLKEEPRIVVHKEFLKGKGFDFRYFTNLTQSKKGNTHAYSVFDISFEKTDENNYLIFRL
jgi:hypothetical protein